MPTDADPIIRLDDFLKRSGFVGTGGEAKLRIQSGEVIVNGEVETRRRKQLAIGDVVELMGQTLVVAAFEE
jgi:ribosome-associated protein